MPLVIPALCRCWGWICCVTKSTSHSFASSRSSTTPLAAVSLFMPYSLIPNLSWSPLLPLPFALRYQHQRACSSPFTSLNASVITIGGCSDSGPITFILHPAFLSIPTPLFPSFYLVSSHSKHSYDSTPFSPSRPMPRTHVRHFPIFPYATLIYILWLSCDRPVFCVPCAYYQVFFFGLDIPMLRMRDTPPLISISTFASPLAAETRYTSFSCTCILSCDSLPGCNFNLKP